MVPGQRILHECAYVLLNLLKELEENVRCEALLSILSVFPNKFNKFNNTGVQMQDSIKTLKSHFINNFCTQNVRFLRSESPRFLWTSTHNNVHVICIFKPLVVHRF